MKPKRPRELASVGGAALLETVEDRELMAAHVDLLERAAQAEARHPRDAREQEAASGSRGLRRLW
jgi:hypothetical protein